MVMQTLDEQDAEAVRFLREQAKDLLQPGYDTDYNLLRWAQGYGFNLEEALFNLTRHLKFRLFYDLDNVDKIKDNKILKQYFPLGLVGKTGMNNQLLVVECAGRIDLSGILRSVQLSAFVLHRFKFQEMMLREINKMEALNKTQCSAVYILDLEGLKLDSNLLSIVTGAIPKQFYWKPDEWSPSHTELDSIVINAGNWKLLTIKVGPCDRKSFLTLNRYCEKTYSMAIYHSADENAVDQNIDEMRDWIPIFDYPAMPTVDLLKVPALGAGVYKFRFGNEQAWFRSLTMYYRIVFVDESDDPIPMEIID